MPVVYYSNGTVVMKADMTEHEEQAKEQQKRPRRADKRKYPAPLPEPVVYYGRSDSQYPKTIRLSFTDGHTEIYDRRLNQPRQDSYINASFPRRRKK